MTARIMVLGLGNTILTDDGAGIYAVRRLREMLEGGQEASLSADLSAPAAGADTLRLARAAVTIKEASLAGFNLLDLVVGFDVLLLVDAMKSSQAEVGEVCQLAPGSLEPTLRLSSIHGINLATALEFGRTMGWKMPDVIEIYVIVAQDTETFGEGCTVPVAAAVPRAAEILRERVEFFLDGFPSFPAPSTKDTSEGGPKTDAGPSATTG